MPSFVWNDFEKIDKDYARCMVDNCGKRLSYKSGTTKGMIQHLRTFHNITEENSLKRERTEEELQRIRDVQGKTDSVINIQLETGNFTIIYTSYTVRKQVSTN
jgi:hypothetical protein